MPPASHRGHPAAPVTASEHGRSIRLDIEGMRTIAVGSVLVAHAGISFLAGGFVGVDVFFVLSGFLITGLLAREVSRTGRVSLSNFWARRLKRLLPASATVLAFSALVTYIWLPITQRETFGGDIVSAALYVVNWRLAARGVDYLAEDIGQSPVQHYWSLAVEEQFYLVWPILMLAIGIIAAKRWKQGAFVVLGLVTVASFAYSIQQTSSSPETAYFVSTTRIWELGIGALLALAATRVAKIPSVIRAIGGWVGIAMILFAVLMFDGSTTWPGVNALVPTVGAALMIASGLTRTPGSPQRLLSLRPMVWIGGLSYSIYLWHWPILIAAQAAYPDLKVRWAILLMIFSVVPAWLCHHYIENPVRFGTRFKPTPRALSIGAGLTALGVIVGFSLSASAGIGGLKQATDGESLGAAALLQSSNRDVVWSDIKSVPAMRPLPIKAPDDRPPFYSDGSGCQVAHHVSKPKLCPSGDTSAKKTIVIVGDSKMAQWQTALDDIARKEHWKIVQITKSACAMTDANVAQNNQPDCRAWGKAAMKEILQLKPDLVIASQRLNRALPAGKTNKQDATQGAMAQGLASYWQRLIDAKIPVAALLDNPAPSTAPVYECVAQHAKDLSACSFDLAQGIKGSGAGAARQAAKLVPGVSVIDMTDTICPDPGRCSAVIGDVLVYRQGSHLTRSYIDSAEPQLAAALFKATDGKIGSKLP